MQHQAGQDDDGRNRSEETSRSDFNISGESDWEEKLQQH